MSNTHKHKIIGKWINNLIPYKNIPMSIKKHWNRHNFYIGEHRHKRNKIRIEDMDRVDKLEI